MLICIRDAAHHRGVRYDCNSFRRIEMTSVISEHAPHRGTSIKAAAMTGLLGGSLHDE
jgi:hypothetical protein